MEPFISEFKANGMICTAFMESDANILIADESLYKFLGQNFPVNLADFIYDSMKGEFLEFVSGCCAAPRTIITKCRCFDGGYRDISVVIRSISLKDNEYIHIDIYDIGIMTKEYKRLTSRGKFIKAYANMSKDIFFRYEVKSGKISLYQEENSIFNGDILQWRDEVISKDYIAGGFIGYFYEICDAVRSADGSGYYTLNTAFFSSGRNEYSKTSIAFCVVDENTAPVYTAGIISNSEFPDRSYCDPLTGIYNKSEIKKLAMAAIETAAGNNTSVVFIIMDLDHFKEVNDLYGHLAGDKALLNAVRIIKSCIGGRGPLGRIGGDEFFAVIPNYSGDIEELRSLLRSIRMHIQWYFAHCKENVKVTCSIGSVCYPNDADNYNDLFKLADFCLYRAKTKGRNRFITFNTEVHGPAEKIINDSAAVQRSGFISDEDKTEHLLSVIGRANENEEPEQFLKTVIAELRHYYAINTVQFCPAAADKEYMEASDRVITEPMAVIEMYDTYKSRIDSMGYLNLGHYMNARSFFPELACFMEKNGMSSILISPFFSQQKELMGVFVFTSDIQYTWSWFDINNLQILCKVMERFL